jgi:hypothetical protein
MQEPISPPIPDLQRLQNELHFLSELSQVVASNTELQPILDWIVGKTVALLSADESIGCR